MDCTLYCMFLSPSTAFTLIYVGGYFSGITWITVQWTDIEDENFTQNKILWIVYCILSLGLFVILQKRELRNFLSQEKIKSK